MFRETGRRVNTEINYTNKMANTRRTWDQIKPELAVLPFSLQIILLQGIFYEKRQNTEGLRGEEIYVWMLRLVGGNSEEDNRTNFDVLLTVHLSILISVINQLDVQLFCFTISLFHASTCFEHMCSS